MKPIAYTVHADDGSALRVDACPKCRGIPNLLCLLRLKCTACYYEWEGQVIELQRPTQ